MAARATRHADWLRVRRRRRVFTPHIDASRIDDDDGGYYNDIAINYDDPRYRRIIQHQYNIAYQLYDHGILHDDAEQLEHEHDDRRAQGVRLQVQGDTGDR